MRRLAALALPYKSELLFAMLALAGGSGINLLLPEIVKRIINTEWRQYLFMHPFNVGVALVALFALQSVCFYFRSYFFNIIGQKAVADLRSRLYQRLVREEMSFFDREKVGDLVSRLGADTLMLQDALSIKLSVFIRYLFQVGVGILLMFVISLRLTIAILICLPILIGVSMFLGKRLRKYSKALQAELGNSTEIAEESFSNIKIVKAFNQENSAKERYSRAVDQVLSLASKRTVTSAFLASFVSFLMNASIVLVMIYGIYLVSQAGLTSGDLTAFLLYGVIVAVSFSFVANGYAEFVQALGASERIFELLDKPLAPEVSGIPASLAANAACTVEFNNVTFSYPSRATLPVLHGVSFTLKAGNSTALVGPSGSGKSTIVSLILRFYDIQSGSVTFAGHEVSSIPASDLRSRTAIVPQDPQLFSVSIAENLRYGNPSASQEQLENACRQAHILKFILSLPQKFATPVGHRGVQLSGGERQRVAIARAILRNPDFLILDEATSALDSENEFLVQGALRTLMRGRTSLIIAHRLSTVKNCDNVIVLEAGSIVQEGTHESLSRTPGLYRDLVQRQELISDAQPIEISSLI